jgi:ClpP class serine protease
MLENYQAYIAKEIGSVEILRAKQSIDKAKVNVIEPITDAQRAEIIDELSAIAKDFIKIVKAGRGARLNTGEENIFTGKMYDSKTALSMGMIDSLGTLQDAIDRAASLASAPSALKGQSAQSNTKTMSLKSKLISMIFGKSEKAEDEKPPTAEEIQAADAQAAEMEAELITLKEASVAGAAKVAELQATVAEQIAQIKTLGDEKATLEAKVAEQKEALDKKPNGQITTVIPGAGEASQAADGKEVKENKFRTKADEEADKYVAALPKNK